MKLTVKVKPNARKNEVKRAEDGTFTIFVTDPPREGKANEKLIELLAEYLEKPKRCISIVAGFKSKIKIVEIE
ncbi:MAG: DUF167 domain-containing protein [Bacteroidota bacterium]|jgi:uncharacterized protein (TIGR00251 family)